jgi:hypothetical protein
LDAPDPTPADSAALIARLTTLLPAAESRPAESQPVPGMSPGLWLQLARAQVRLLGAPFWAASLLVLGLGLALGLAGDGSLLAIAFVLCAPILAALGVAYVFRPEARSLRELEQISPVGALELLFVRLGVALAFNTALCLILLGLITLREPQIVLWRLLVVWLGPMLALTGTALYASLRLGSPAGVAVPLGLWGLLMLLGWHESRLQGGSLLGQWVLTQVSHSDAFLLGAVIALLVGLLLVRQAERYLRQEITAWP